ncbi:hypothetical protein OIDMADRAFT_49234 [Oidiodendron maius Zn]|uniref:DUF7357 domain-containing protein n=1 Tax=Oidiodendron maius (strain Zn) TaxID=913774 RepID=A0A0C3D389_OIDMZ|nr:hypothetical protein OIDMADRAFT_49234 [Oidiodendron maius Zn]
MRLRLIVKRNDLPLMPVVWNVPREFTIAQLLEQVSEVIPLESGEWGLEDYVVELPGQFGLNFECLHYQQVETVMREDEEVIIRPLLAHDLKVRRISGRRQISSDGKHLMDGLAFGRPLLKKPVDRPAVKIPPRKRQRLADDDMGNGDEIDEGIAAQEWRQRLKVDDSDYRAESNQQLLLDAQFGDEESEDDEDFAPGEDDEDDNDGDSSDDYEVDREAESDREEDIEDDEDCNQLEIRSLDDVEIGSPHNDLPKSPKASLHELHAAFPTSPITICKNVLDASNGNLNDAYDAMARGFRPSKPKSAIAEPMRRGITVRKTRSKMNNLSSTESETLDDQDLALDETTSPLLGYYDQNGLPKGSIASGTVLSHMTELFKTSTQREGSTTKGRVASNKSVRFAEDSPADELTSTSIMHKDPQIDTSEEESKYESSRSDISSSDVESDNEETSETSETGSDIDGSGNDEESGDSSDDNSAPEERSSKLIPGQQKVSAKDPAPSSVPNNQKSVQPGEGRKQTKARNIRRRNAIALKKLKEKGILPADTTAAEYNKLSTDSNTTREEALAALGAIRAASLSVMSSEFLTRRQNLLNSLESGGIEVGPDSLRESPKSQSVANTKVTGIQSHDSLNQMEIDGDISTHSIQSVPVESGNDTTLPTRRMKLDLGAGRRLLFGALGIKNPKTKEDEDKLRNDIMKGVKPLAAPKHDVSAPAPSRDDVDEDTDAWRQSILYRAVECCHDNIELSEPPFPFVQRWDPQQQGGKRKKDLREEPKFYDSNSRPFKRQKLRKAKHSYAEEQEYLDDSYETSYQDSTVIDYDETAKDSELPDNKTRDETSSQYLEGLNYDESANGSQEPADLAPLPKDPSTLPNLNADEVMTGMTIAFKQLIMSEETKWQPQISPYRTAIVIANPDNGELHLTLALRDRRQPQKYYDEETGDRIYGRFDIPVEDDEEEQEDDGMLNLQFSELIEPKIVQNAPDSLIIDAAKDIAAQAWSDANSDNSNTSRVKKGPANEQFSHVTETPLNSEVPESYVTAQHAHQPENDPITLGQVSDIHSPESHYTQDNAELREQGFGQRVTLANSIEKAASNDNSNIAGTSLAKVAETISDEARQEISIMMREAGFRSSIPSSIGRDIRLNGMKSPGDAAIFERLMKDMTEMESHTLSSPKFNGFGSSSPITQKEQDVGSAKDLSQQVSTSSAPSQSSWQTISFDEPIALPAKMQQEEIDQDISEDDDGGSWEIIGPSFLPEIPSKRRLKRKLHMAQPIQKANLLWEQLSRVTSNNPPASTAVVTKEGQEVSTQGGPDAVNGQDINGSVQYPKLTVGSSFISQISDHGRQPDPLFDDSTVVDGGLLKASTEASLPNHDIDRQQADYVVTDIEPELPSQPVSSGSAGAKGKEILPDLPSSDDFPPLEVVLSQRDVAAEERTPVFPARQIEEDQEDCAVASSDATTPGPRSFMPKLPQNSTKIPRHAKSQHNGKTRSSVARSSQSPAVKSQPTKFTVPKGSQILDLTLSSDVEEEQEFNAFMPAFRRYKIADNDDDDYRDGDDGKAAGRVKTKPSQTETPRRGKRLRSSSQASSNLRSTRKKAVA